MDQTALLEDLDRRQNDVLDRLAELNAQIEGLIQECLLARDQELRGDEDSSMTAVAPPAPPSAQPETSQPASAPAKRTRRNREKIQ